MKAKRFLLPSGLLALALLILGACAKEEETCQCCDLSVSEYVLDSVTVKMYSAITPNATPFENKIETVFPLPNGKDSTITIALPTTPNPDTVYNDSINQGFFIDNLESLTEPKLEIFKVTVDGTIDDKHPVYKNPNYSNFDPFVGFRNFGEDQHKALVAGRYRAVLTVYTTEGTATAQHDFCLMWNGTLDNSGLKGKQMPDPLLK